MNAQEALTSGYGFASFLFILAAVGALSVSIYICVPLCGSDLEKRTLHHPHEFETSAETAPIPYYSNNNPTYTTPETTGYVSPTAPGEPISEAPAV